MQHNVTSSLSVTALLYSNVMRIITGSSNDLQVTERERALAEEIKKDTRFVTQVSGHLGCHDRSKVRAQDVFKVWNWFNPMSAETRDSTTGENVIYSSQPR